MKSSEKIGLVLSGGGAKGAYQIGAWKALNKLKIKYDIVTGTSVGALNGLMFVQKDYKKAYKIWKNIDYNFIFDNGQELIQENNSVYKTYIEKFFKNGGMEVKQLEKGIANAYDEKKFYSSPIDYGIVIFNLSKLKPESLTKKQLPKNLIKDYVLASSCAFPVFKIKKIAQNKYIDGGYYDNMPINLCISMGATKIIAIDMKAIGIKQKTKNKNIEIKTITPNNEIIPLMVFDKELSIKTMKFGYNDTMKSFGIYDGNKYTFKKNQMQRLDKKLKLQTQIIKIISKLSLNKQKKVYDILSKITILEILEYIGKTYHIEECMIYSIKTYNKLIKKQFKNLCRKKINDLITKINIGSNSLIHNIYFIDRIIEFINSGDANKIEKLAHRYPKELLTAIYINTMITNGNF